MRVLHLGKFYPPHPGGVERITAELMAAQSAAGAQVAALVHRPRAATSPARRWHDDGVLIDPVTSFGQLVFAPISPSWPLRFAWLLRDFRPDLLHLHVPNPSVFWMLASAAARRVPWIVHWHADIPEDSKQLGLRLGYPVYRQFEHRMLRRAARVVATSARYLEASRALTAVAPDARVIPLGLAEAVDPGIAPEWPPGELRVLAVGRLSYYKGFVHLLDAMQRCPRASLVLVGAGEQRDELEARIRKLGLQSRVRMTGSIDDATLEAAYRACDMFCLPSIDRAEAFGMVLLEAMRAGKPVVASDIPGSGVGSVVVDGETGLMTPPGDADALAQALSRLGENVEVRLAMGAAGRRRWEQHYRIDSVSRAWLDLYREVLADQATAG